MNMGTAIKHPVMSDRVKPSFVIFDIQHQSARMSKIINDDLTQSGTGCFIAVPICHQWASTVKLYSTTVFRSQSALAAEICLVIRLRCAMLPTACKTDWKIWEI